MNNHKLEGILHSIDPNLSRSAARWQLDRHGVTVVVLTDERADRMRFIAVVGCVDTTDAALLERLLVANFESALDARYAAHDGILWSAFLHPSRACKEPKSRLRSTGRCVGRKHGHHLRERRRDVFREQRTYCALKPR